MYAVLKRTENKNFMVEHSIFGKTKSNFLLHYNSISAKKHTVHSSDSNDFRDDTTDQVIFPILPALISTNAVVANENHQFAQVNLNLIENECNWQVNPKHYFLLADGCFCCCCCCRDVFNWYIHLNTQCFIYTSKLERLLMFSIFIHLSTYDEFIFIFTTKIQIS